MNLDAQLVLSSDEFLRSTNNAYDDCSAGISTLDKIIVAVPSSLAPTTRTMLVPILYAYWERFFRITFSEFARCVSLAQIPLSRANLNLARFRLRKEFGDFLERAKVKDFPDIVTALGIDETRLRLGGLHLCIDAPLTFDRPTECVRTYSNVRFAVLQENCTNLGIDLERIKAVLDDSNITLFIDLNEFVDARNKIAHGETIGPMPHEDWEKKRNFALSLMTAVQLVLYEILQDKTKLLRI